MLRLLTLLLVLLNSAALNAATAEDDAIVLKYEGQQAVRELEIKISTIRGYDAEKRRKEELKLGDEMKRLERKYRDTKANNRILYLLADWQVTYETDEALQTLTQLKDSSFSVHKGTIDLIRVRYYLKVGDTKEARVIVNAVTERIPELSPVSDLVALYERVGEDAPHIEGNNLSGGSKDPLLDSSEPFILYYFIELADDWQTLHLKEFTDELKREPYLGKFKIVCVCFDHKYINSIATWNGLSEKSKWDLIWANPNPKGDAEQWKTTWGVKSLPNCVLVGADRKILDINPSLQDIQILAGENPSKSSTSNGIRDRTRSGPRWR